MSDAAVLSRIEAWESAGLIDAPTAARLRGAELARGDREAAGGGGASQARGSIASAFGPSATVAEMFGYLGAGFLLAAWHALLLTGSHTAADEAARNVMDSLVPAIVFALGGLFLAARDSDRMRRAAGVAFAVATVHAGTTAWFMVQAAAPGIGDEARMVIATFVGAAAAVGFRFVHPALLTQAALVGSLIALALALLRWINLLFPVSTQPDWPELEFQERDPSVAAQLVVLTAAWWIAWAVAIALLGRGEAAAARRAGATPAGHAAARRATLTRFVAGMVAVAGTASAVSQSNGYASGNMIRSVEPWLGDLAVVAVSLVLLWLAFRNASAYLVPSAIGVVYVLTDLNATYVAPESGVGAALLVEGLILLGVGLAADRLRRRLHPALTETVSSPAASPDAPTPVEDAGTSGGPSASGPPEPPMPRA